MLLFDAFQSSSGLFQRTLEVGLLPLQVDTGLVVPSLQLSQALTQPLLVSAQLLVHCLQVDVPLVEVIKGVVQ